MLRSQARRRQKGAVAIEFAIMAPFVFAVLFGIVEFGMAFWRKQELTAAVREGARYGIVKTSSNLSLKPSVSQIQTKVRNYLVNAGWASADIPAAGVTGAQGASGTSLTVTQTYPTSFLILSHFPAGAGISVDGSGKVTLTATITMQNE